MRGLSVTRSGGTVTGMLGAEGLGGSGGVRICGPVRPGSSMRAGEGSGSCPGRPGTGRGVASACISGEAAGCSGESAVCVVRLVLVYWWVAGERPEFQQGAGRAGSTVAAADDRAVWVHLGRVVRVQVGDQGCAARAGSAQAPGSRSRAGVGEHVAERDPAAGSRSATGVKARDRECRQTTRWRGGGDRGRRDVLFGLRCRRRSSRQ